MTTRLLVCILLISSLQVLAGDKYAKLEEFSVLPKTFEQSADPQQQQLLLYDFIWRSFIALNWPNVPLVIKDTPKGPRITSGPGVG